MKLFSNPSLPTYFLTYGAFASLCHATAILFVARLSNISFGEVLFHRYFPMLEYSLMSFILTLCGAMLIEYVLTKVKEP